MRLHLPTFAALLLAAPALSAASAHQQASQQQPIQLWRKALNKISSVNWVHHPGKTSIATAGGEEKEAQRQQLPLELLSRYGKDVVWRFNLTSAEDALALAKASGELALDVWEFNDNWVDVRLAKDAVPKLLDLLPPSLQQSHTPLFGDLELAEAVFASYPSSTTPITPTPRSFTPSLRPPSTDIFFQEYRPLSVITPWMRLMASIFTTHVRFLNIGVSHEGRDIPALRLGVHPKNNKDKSSGPRKTILITGGSHAREWISTSTVTYVAWSIITSYGKSALVTSMLESFDWVFVPTLNPDGYVYSWETDRLWRKSRQPTGSKFCAGIDLDRSYPFHWDGNITRENPCSETYAGREAFEGVETKRFAEWAKNETEHNNVTLVGFLDLHSYSQQVLWPYSYSCEAEPPGLENLEELALGLAKAMRLTRGGAHYMAASACEGNVGFRSSKAGEKKGRMFAIESGGGSALDWFYEELRVEYAYQIKLRDTGSYGFLLPKGNIVPTGREVLDAVYYFGKYLMGEVGLKESGKLEGKPHKEASQDDTIIRPHEEEEGPRELRRRRL